MYRKKFNSVVDHLGFKLAWIYKIMMLEIPFCRFRSLIYVFKVLQSRPEPDLLHSVSAVVRTNNDSVKIN
jgi:hypothetical protein